VWLGLDVGSDIALANAIGREIIAAGLCNTAFIERGTTGFDAYREASSPARLTGRRSPACPAT
jgi:anaerobic selenocysteine-containing dehydrogenase